MMPTPEKLPYDHNYLFKISLGLPLGKGTTINPAEHSEYSEAEWNALTPSQQEAWLDNELELWKQDTVIAEWQQ